MPQIPRAIRFTEVSHAIDTFILSFSSIKNKKVLEHKVSKCLFETNLTKRVPMIPVPDDLPPGKTTTTATTQKWQLIEMSGDR